MTRGMEGSKISKRDDIIYGRPLSVFSHKRQDAKLKSDWLIRFADCGISLWLSLLPNLGYVFDEKFWQNAVKFAIYIPSMYIKTRNPQLSIHKYVGIQYALKNLIEGNKQRLSSDQINNTLIIEQKYFNNSLCHKNIINNSYTRNFWCEVLNFFLIRQ